MKILRLAINQAPSQKVSLYLYCLLRSHSFDLAHLQFHYFEQRFLFSFNFINTLLIDVFNDLKDIVLREGYFSFKIIIKKFIIL